MANIEHLSFEFFPPRDELSRSKLVDNVASQLASFGPEFFSVTYGAGGSTRDGTRQTVAALQSKGLQAVPHLSMGTDEASDIKDMLDTFKANGVDRLVALRGDQPSGLGANHRLSNNAEALIRLIRAHSDNHFHLTVAAYPEIHPDSSGTMADMQFFKRKVDAGANSAITQYFYNADAYCDFMERCAIQHIDIPIYAGIMPITNVETLVRFSAKAGAEIPRWLQYGLSDRKDNEKNLIDYGVEVVSRLCQQLIQAGAPGLHFYTLNRWGATTRICNNLGLQASN